ncbi:hypothetical protein NC653_003058 [Populus alba x Populus x berolinensis]|uniref:BEACH domain-containing protein n=1 Tax=Populus alba x Populus x berolinensis TaxID=444605 RepID=A0AAD6RQL1_9ROSI|nr:hypothetical protein NC653_003058 [Populus alba x Populus x berolinensis]
MNLDSPLNKQVKIVKIGRNRIKSRFHHRLNEFARRRTKFSVADTCHPPIGLDRSKAIYLVTVTRRISLLSSIFSSVTFTIHAEFEIENPKMKIPNFQSRTHNKSLSGGDNDPVTPVFTPSLSSVLTRHTGNVLLSFPSSTIAGDIGRSGLFTSSRSAHHHHLHQQPREGEEEFRKRCETWDDPEVPKFHYGSHYSSAGIVLFYLPRLPPFSVENQKLQGGQFDHADRLFNSIRDTWLSAAGKGNTSDVKELIPEFFYIPNWTELIELG